MWLHLVKMLFANTICRDIEIDERAGPTHAKDTHDLLSASFPPNNLRDDVSMHICELGKYSLTFHRCRSQFDVRPPIRNSGGQ